ncbi:hypothetical protein NL676_022418 [Syzygium grande]|nr:hypothetical protein NL676_022418 [Syzygium grande]
MDLSSNKDLPSHAKLPMTEKVRGLAGGSSSWRRRGRLMAALRRAATERVMTTRNQRSIFYQSDFEFMSELDEPWGLAGSCHGLVSLAVDDGFLVYNPTTKESRKLPRSNLVAEHEFFHGFGYNSATDDYKIVHGAFFTANDGSKECVLEILGIHGGHLFIYDGTWKPRFEAWIMNEYGKEETWTRLFTILTDGLPACQLYTIPIAYNQSGKIVFKIDVSEMILFNPEDGIYKNYPIEEYDNVKSTIYMETLVSPDVGHEPCTSSTCAGLARYV